MPWCSSLDKHGKVIKASGTVNISWPTSHGHNRNLTQSLSNQCSRTWNQVFMWQGPCSHNTVDSFQTGPSPSYTVPSHSPVRAAQVSHQGTKMDDLALAPVPPSELVCTRAEAYRCCRINYVTDNVAKLPISQKDRCVID